MISNSMRFSFGPRDASLVKYRLSGIGCQYFCDIFYTIFC